MRISYYTVGEKKTTWKENYVTIHNIGIIIVGQTPEWPITSSEILKCTSSGHFTIPWGKVPFKESPFTHRRTAIFATPPGSSDKTKAASHSENWKMLSSEDAFQSRKASRHVRIQS